MNELIFNEYERQANRVSLYNYLQYYNIEMIMNNNLIDKFVFELENYYELKQNLINEKEEEIKELTKELIYNEYGHDITDEEYDEVYEECEEDIIKRLTDELYYIDVYQYFIIHENDKDYFSILNYPIYYSYDIDMYLVGITHIGCSWTHILTDIKLKDEGIDTDQVYNLLSNIN